MLTPLALIAFVSLAAASPTGAPDAPAAAPAPLGPGGPHLDPHRCVTDEQLETARRAANPEAFSDSAIPLGPFFWASRDRTFLQVMLVYWRYLSVEDRSRLDVVFPFMFSYCAPEADTFVGPLGTMGWKTDVLGTAGYIGPYFFRRDSNAITDVLFPLFWRWEDVEGAVLVAGPYFDVAQAKTGREDFGFAPLYWGTRLPGGGYTDRTPIAARWGNASESNLWALQTFAHEDARGWEVQSWPVYFAGADKTTGVHHTIIPPLLFASWGDPYKTRTLAGPVWSFSDRNGYDMGVFPLYARGRHQVRGVRDDYDITPLAARFSDENGTKIWALQTFAHFTNVDDVWSVASVPFVFAGQRGAEHHTIIPPLAFARWGDARETNTIAGPYFSFAERASNANDAPPVSEDFGVAPLYWGHRDASGGYHDLTPLGGRWGDNTERNLVAGPYFSLEQLDATRPDRVASSDFGIAPLYWGHRDARGGYHDITPLGARWGDPYETHTWILQTFADRTTTSWDVHSWPVYFAGEDVYGGHYTLIPPALFARWGDADHTRTIAALAWWFEERARIPGDTSGRREVTGADFGFFPLYAGGRHGVDEYDLTPVAARFSDRDGTKLWALQTYATWAPRGEQWSVASVPFYFGGADRDGAYHHLVPPALTAAWGDPQHANLVAGPFMRFTLGSDAEWSRTSTDIAVAPLYLSGDVDGERPYASALVEGIAHDTFGFSRFDERFHYRVVPPLLYAHLGDDHSERTVLAQSWLFRSDRADANGARTDWDAGSFPFYAGGRHGDGYYDLTPVFARWGDATKSRLVAGPYFEIDSPTREDLGVFPVYFAGHAQPARADGSSAWDYRIVAPVYAGLRDEAGGYIDATPVFARWGDARSGNVWAAQTLVTWDETAWTALSFPFYAGRAEQRGAHDYVHVVPPLLTAAWGDDAHQRLVAGPYFRFTDAAADEFGVFPVYTGSVQKDGGWYHLTPLGGAWGSKSETNVWALQTYVGWADDEWRALSFPFYAGYTEATGAHEYLHVAPPLLTAAWGDDARQRLVAGPYFRFTDAAEDAFGVFPVYTGSVQKDGGWYHLTPIAGAWGDDTATPGDIAGTETNVWALQTYVGWDDYEWRALSFPFYAGHANETGDYGHLVPPLLTAAWGDRSYHQLVAGPFWRLETGEYDDVVTRGAAPDVHSGLLGVYAWGPHYFVAGPMLYGQGDVEDLHWRVVPPLLYGHVGDDSGNHEFTLFAQSFLLRDDDAWTAGSLPFYLGGRSGDASGGYYDLTLLAGRFGDAHETNLYAGQTYVGWDETSWRAVSVPLYFGGDDGDGWHHIVPPALSASWGSRKQDTSTTFVVPPLYMSWHTPEEDRTLALLYYGRESKDGSSAHALAPFYFAGSRGDNEWSVLLPLWARTKQGTEYFDAYTPLFYSWGDADEKRTLFLPTLTYASSVRGEDFLVAPGVWHQKTSERDDTVVFPFVWRFSDPKSRALVVSGVYWDLEWPDDGKKLTIAPGVLRWSDPEEDFTIAGPVSWSNGKGEREKAWSFHLFPVVSVWSYHPGHVRWRALGAGFGYEEERQKSGKRREVMVLGMKFDPDGAKPKAPADAPPG